MPVAERKILLATNWKRWADANPKRRKETLGAWYGARPEYLRAYHLKRKYSITLEDYDRMAEAQGHACAVCRTTEVPTTGKGKHRRWFVDHDHTTGQVRGLLCNACNLMVGYADDNPARLEAAAQYLKRHRAKADTA